MKKNKTEKKDTAAEIPQTPDTPNPETNEEQEWEIPFAEPTDEKDPEETNPEDPKDKEIAELKDRYLRLLAEYDNFRKRSRSERDALFAEATIDASKEWLSVIDNIERALEFSADTENVSAKVAEGVSLIYKQAGEVLAKLGIEPIECEVGGAFDPNLHSAVMHIEDDTLGEQTIAAIFQKGYRKGDRVLRYAMVQVAN